jgi:hypothetical protein
MERADPPGVGGRPIVKRISSGSTFLFKRILPAFWFLFLAVFLGSSLSIGWNRVNPMLIGGPLLMAAILFVVAKRFLWNLADEVQDGGDHLRIRRGSVEERIALADILNVSVTVQQHPQRIALRLVRPGRLGDEITFLPATRFRWNPFARNEVAEDLIVRVDRARAERTR